MTSLEMLFAFAQVVFPASLIVPTILAVLPPDEPPVGLAILFFIPIAQLWVTILVATLILLPQAATDARITLATLVIVGLLLTYGLMRIAPFVLEVNLRIKVG